MNKCKGCDKQISYIGRKFCSKECYWKSKIGVSHSWGDKISEALKGKPKSPEHILNASRAHTGMRHPSIQGENHPGWKGDMAGYDAIHDWVRRYRGTPKKCEHCGIEEENRVYQWSNISGKYIRELSDWERLCIPCHRAKDKNIPRASFIFMKKNRNRRGYSIHK